jgi:hypothetical protein
MRYLLLQSFLERETLPLERPFLGALSVLLAELEITPFREILGIADPFVTLFLSAAMSSVYTDRPSAQFIEFVWAQSSVFILLGVVALSELPTTASV